MTYSQDPRGPRQPFLLVPWPVVLLIGLLVVCYLAFVLAPVPLENRILTDYAFIPARYAPSGFLAAYGTSPGSLFDRALPFVTYIFIHASPTHIFVNSIWMLPFGAVVARRYHALVFFFFFFVCGVGGAAAHLASNWGSVVPVVGASGAISGLMGAAFRMMGPPWRSPERPQASWPPLAPIFSPRILTWSAVWVGVNIVAGVLGLGAGPHVGLIAWQAHLGGYFTGLFLAGPFAALAARLEPGSPGYR